MLRFKLLNILICFSLNYSINSQNNNTLNTKLLDSLMLEKKIKQADAILKTHLSYIELNNINDSLYKYPYYVGKIELLKSNAKSASIKANEFLNYITSRTKDNKVHYKSLLELADFYDEIGNDKKALDLTKSALEIIKKSKNTTPEDIGKVEYNVGATLLNLGNINEAKVYFSRALNYFESYKLTKKTQLSDGYNAMGATMWMSSKLDSAKYYYSKAIKTIELAEGNPMLNLYLGTVIKSNISLLEYTQGNLAEAINVQNEVILNYEKTIKNYKNQSIVSKAQRFQARAISNMAVFYSEQGNFKKAYDLILYSYRKKKQLHESDDSDLIYTLILLGQAKISLQDYEEALRYLKEGIYQFEANTIKNPYWQAVGLHAMAEAYIAQKKIKKAKKCYEESEILFKEALGNVYDTEFLSFLRNKSFFMAKNNETELALKTANSAYKYVLKNGGEDNFGVLKQLLNLSKINYSIKNYQHTINWIEKANHYLNNTLADTKQIEFYKPQLILLKSKTLYELTDIKDTAFLKQQLEDLDNATSILEERKTTVFKSEDINIVLSEYQEVSNFSKNLALELYQKSNDLKHLNKVIELHESSIYHRIRSRLNLKNNISFIDVPTPILERETILKNKMSSSLENSEDIQTFLSINQNWNHFLDTLKTKYPKYYKMRYATIEEPLKNLQKNIRENTTVVRYLFIEKQLYAIILNENEKKIFKLNSDNLKENINTLGENQSNFKVTSTLLHKLYRQLWQPFETDIATKNVIIIPDAELFNLSFETLTSKGIESFNEFTTNSLLAKYSISYNYSLLLLDDNKKTINYTNDFIAFAPEFNDKMKSDYKIAVTDSLVLDKSYLTLLPQPFSVDLAKEYSKLFNGNSFLNEKASKQLFTNEAKEHKIIHIGTHAESNNVSPELSRLIFAKNASDEDNSLYTYEIYNQNLSSNLAILTACETGKPTYQAGEGMISLAHAFNYAGSESILTSLWKIDEQSSSKIIENFYNYIKKGLPKDEALQKAKLDYISNAEGRTISPQYWAGLVLIGDTTAIEINTSSNIIWYLFTVLLIIIGLVYIRKKYKN